jgi:hypothetical protein
LNQKKKPNKTKALSDKTDKAFLSIKTKRLQKESFLYKAVDGFEPTIKLLQSRALPLGYTALTFNIIP